MTNKSSEGSLTVSPHHHRRGRAQHGGVGHHISHCAGVVAGVRGLHLGDVEVARLLGDEAPGVLPQETSLPVHHPGELHLWTGSRWKQSRQLKQSLSPVIHCFLGFDDDKISFFVQLCHNILHFYPGL